MSLFSYLRVELNRILHLRIVHMIIILTMISPIMGYNSKETMFKTMLTQSTSGDLIVKPCITGALVGGGLFALLTLIEFHRVNKYQIRALTDRIMPPLVLNVVRVIALGIIATVSVTITTLMYFPYVVMKMEYTFDAYAYLRGFFLFMLPFVLLSILGASAFYQILFSTNYRITK